MEQKMDNRHRRTVPTLSRRALLRGLGATSALGLAGWLAQPHPASAQFKFSFGNTDIDVGRIFSGAKSLFESWNLSVEDEVPMGQSLYPGVQARSGGLYRNRRAQADVARFAEPLFNAAGRTDLEWQVVLINRNEVNAWALPGGKLGINKGLLRYIDTPDELAAVIAHEMGHVEKSHHIAEMKTKQFTAGLTELGQAGLEARQGTSFRQSLINEKFREKLILPMFDLVSRGYSRDHELEADGHILTIFERTGHDPLGAVKFFETLLSLIPEGREGTTSLFSTHPGTRERIDKLRGNLSGTASAGAVPGEFAELKQMFPTRSRHRISG